MERSGIAVRWSALLAYVLLTVKCVFSKAALPDSDIVVLSKGKESTYSSFSGGLCLNINAASDLARSVAPTPANEKYSSFPLRTCLSQSLYFSWFATRLFTSGASRGYACLRTRPSDCDLLAVGSSSRVAFYAKEPAKSSFFKVVADQSGTPIWITN